MTPDLLIDGRRVPFAGAHNFRDLGGYIGYGGRPVRYGRVFRSDHLNTLTDADLDLFETLGIQVVHDFRLEKERERQPSRYPPNAPEVLILATSDTTNINETLIDVVMDMLAGRRPMAPPTFWEENYIDLVDNGRPMFVKLFASIADLDRLPTMFHCTGGKDRTGIAAALLLRMLGVDETTIVNDFLLTNTYRTPQRLEALRPQFRALGITDEQVMPILGVTEAALRTALSRIDGPYGGPERYLIDAGLDPAVPARLRQLLLSS